VVAIDGDQPCPGTAGFHTFTFNVEKQHRRIEAALTASGVTPPAEGLTIIGYSQGAAILEHLAAKYPSRYARIVIISPPSAPLPSQYKASRAVVTMSCSRDVPARMKAAAKGIAALGIPSLYIEMPGCTHGNLADAEATFARTFAWFDEHAL
jgi:predicted esterase